MNEPNFRERLVGALERIAVALEQQNASFAPLVDVMQGIESPDVGENVANTNEPGILPIGGAPYETVRKNIEQLVVTLNTPMDELTRKELEKIERPPDVPLSEAWRFQ